MSTQPQENTDRHGSNPSATTQRVQRSIWASFALLGLLSACNGVPLTDNTPYGIVLTCTPVSLTVGQTGSCSATAKDKAGVAISPQPSFEFSSSNANSVSVSSTGVIKGLANGNADVAATVSAARVSSLPVTVRVGAVGVLPACGSFTAIGPDSKGRAYNGQSQQPLVPDVAPTNSLGFLITCTQTVSIGVKTITRQLSFTIADSVLKAGQKFFSYVNYLEEDPTRVCPKTTSNAAIWSGRGYMSIEEVGADNVRFSYSNIELEGDKYLADTTCTSGILSASGTITAPLK
jgi:hypothetical protein